MSEIWKAVPGYEGLYEVSNCGRVRSLDRWVNTKGGAKRKVSGQIVSTRLNVINGYRYVVLRKDGKNIYRNVHRLVAIAFIPNPNNYPYVNHKDENRGNSCVDNLEWCTNAYNLMYGTAKEKMDANVKARSKQVVQISLSGDVIEEYNSINEASRHTGVDVTGIWGCCNGRYGYKTAGGYKWKFKTE